ncbi:hypothetical protein YASMINEVIRUS_648 [Yasminevirus sp. GU-2018]|uniref:Uncharacterized protein n=1 Tax=Yasminevirus sp. GU-2018 TaxID=2420051 RepID=A0A5K0U8R7_9VIRU|nr:hypothetical protein YASMINEVIRUS_648 [Yasminevirus sp. GU-2018]
MTKRKYGQTKETTDGGDDKTKTKEFDVYGPRSYVADYRRDRVRDMNDPNSYNYKKFKSCNKKGAVFTGAEVKFMHWIAQVERLVYNKLQMRLLDLSDEAYMMMFEEGVEPEYVANIVIKSAFDF